MKGRNTAWKVLTLTVTIVGLTNWNTLPLHPLRQTAKAASSAVVTKLTGLSDSSGPSNGKIVFTSVRGNNDGIHTMNADGSERVFLTSGSEPAWSPDGTLIAFVRTEGLSIERGIYIMNADGSNQKQITQDKPDRSPAWSPDGTRLAFSRDIPTISSDIYVVDADGSDQRIVIHGGYGPAWSPDGSRLAIAGDNYSLYIVDIDGSNETRIAIPPVYDSSYAEPAWSPDGSKIYFTRWTGCDTNACHDPEIWTVNADGSNPTWLQGLYGYGINWSPDGMKIIFANGGDLFVMNPDGSGATNISNTSVEHEYEPSWGPLLFSCANSISPTSRTFDAVGGTGSVDVTAGSECIWSASTFAGWITIASGSGSSGNGMISYLVAANDSTASRIGVLFVANRTLLVSQAGMLTRIIAASVAGKRLFVFGENFDPGAVILLNGKEQKTKNDNQDPKATLISKKAGKKIRPGDKLRVRNPNGTLSEEFTFTGS